MLFEKQKKSDEKNRKNQVEPHLKFLKWPCTVGCDCVWVCLDPLDPCEPYILNLTHEGDFSIHHVWSQKLHLWINEQTCQNHLWNPSLKKQLSTPKIPNHHPPKQQNVHFISSSKAHHSACRRHQFHADDQNKPSAQWVNSFLELCWTMWVFPKIGVITPKWMVKIMENPIEMDDLGGKPTIFGNIHVELCWKTD